VLDGRQPKQLANILSASQNTPDGWLIIDGGGNRPAFDSEIAGEVDLRKVRGWVIGRIHQQGSILSAEVCLVPPHLAGQNGP